jgi:hypothetical protein
MTKGAMIAIRIMALSLSSFLLALMLSVLLRQRNERPDSGVADRAPFLVGSQAHQIYWTCVADGHQAGGHEETILLEPGEL